MEKQGKFSMLDGIRFLWPYARKFRYNFAMFYFGWFVQNLLSLAFPIIFAAMIDEIVYYKNLTAFLNISLVFVAMAAFSAVLFFLIYTFDLVIKSVFTFDLRLAIFKRVQIMTAKYMADMKTGDLIQLINGDSMEAPHFVIRNLFHFTNGVIACLFYIGYLFFISPLAGGLVLVCAPISACISLKFGRKIRGYAAHRREVYGGYLSWLVEVLRGLRDIRLLTAEPVVRQKLDTQHAEIFGVSVKSSVSSITADRLIQLVNLIIQLALFCVAGYLAARGELTIGVFTVLITFFFDLKGSIIHLSRNNMDAQNRLTHLQRVSDFMALPIERKRDGTHTLTVEQGRIEFDGVDFAYDRGVPVFEGLCLDIAPGEKLALVGASGCGKSTAAELLMGFFAPTHGTIRIDGQDISGCSLHSLRAAIGVVQQEVLIFDASIRENLLLANRNAADDTLWAACEKAGIAEFFRTYPEGLDTVIGASGVGLSGGQRQRLAIARIYVKNPKILIFDEATGSLDDETERQVHGAWAQLLVGRTAIVIAHRQSSVMLCRRAALLAGGQVTAYGDPRELCENDPQFRALFALDQGEGQAT